MRDLIVPDINGDELRAGSAEHHGVVSNENCNEPSETDRPQFPLSFSFEWYGIAYFARGVEGVDGPVLQICGSLGPVPYTAESAKERKAVGSILALAPEFLDLRMSLSSENEIVIEGELPLDGSITPSRIVATASAFVASAKPLIEVVKLAAPVFGPKTQVA
jgi:hypothetical protein